MEQEEIFTPPQHCYAVKMVCLNCNHKGTISVPKRQLKPDKETCPECLCDTYEPRLL